MPIERTKAVANRQVARLTLAVAGGLTLTTLSGVAIPGLAPVLAMQMLMGPKVPGIRLGGLLVLVVFVTTEAIRAITIVFGDRPQVLIAILALLYSLGFLFQPRIPIPSLLFLLTVALVPVWMAKQARAATCI